MTSQLILIGEAVRRLSVEFQSAHPQIPWPQIAGMRNRLVHGYDKIKWSLEWKTAREDVPDPLAHLEPHVPEEELEGGATDDDYA